jgi:hypothetical protein
VGEPWKLQLPVIFFFFFDCRANVIRFSFTFLVLLFLQDAQRTSIFLFVFTAAVFPLYMLAEAYIVFCTSISFESRHFASRNEKNRSRLFFFASVYERTLQE